MFRVGVNVFCLQSLFFSHRHFLFRFPNTGCQNGCDSLLQDGDTVTFINIHDLTRNFVLHCACPFQQEPGLRSYYDECRAGRVPGGGVKYQKTVGKLSLRASRDVIARDGPDLVRMRFMMRASLCLYISTYLKQRGRLPLAPLHVVMDLAIRDGCWGRVHNNLQP